MRGRLPRTLIIQPEDIIALQKLARSRIMPAFAVQRAGILIAVTRGERIGAVADRFQCDPASIWRVCRRFERLGLPSVLSLLTPREQRSSEPSPTLEYLASES